MDCKFFGVRTSKGIREANCRVCETKSPEVFVKCTVETNTLLGTSIDTDSKGNTIQTQPKKVPDDRVFNNS